MFSKSIWVEEEDVLIEPNKRRGLSKEDFPAIPATTNGSTYYKTQ